VAAAEAVPRVVCGVVPAVAAVAAAVVAVPLVPSVVRVGVVPLADVRARSSGVKSSTTCRPRRSVACRFRVATAKSSGCREVPR